MSTVRAIVDILSTPGITKETGLDRCLELIIPRKPPGEVYLPKQVDGLLISLRDEILQIQQENNEEFEKGFDESTYFELHDVYKNLHDLQLEVMKLQCDIAFTKEQYDTMLTTCDNPTVQGHRETLTKEAELRRRQKQITFRPIEEFFEKFTNYLQVTECATRMSCLSQVNLSADQQMFDWSKFKQLMFLIRATGRSLIELDRFERLYQSEAPIISLSFKQNLNKMNLEDFVHLYEDCSLETQVEVLYGNDTRTTIFAILRGNDTLVKSIVESRGIIKYQLLDKYHMRLGMVLNEFTRILIDMNMAYIEAHLTEGINIDKLNGNEYGIPISANSLLQKPKFAYSPQAYITQIGQHLLTMRQHIEPYDKSENGYLKFALNTSLGNLPILSGINPLLYSSITATIMRAITYLCIKSVLGRTGRSIISKLSPDGKQQLSTDCLYLDNVLEDMGLLDLNDPHVKNFKSLIIG